MRGTSLSLVPIFFFALFCVEKSAFTQTSLSDTVFLNKNQQLFSSNNNEIKEASADTLYWIQDSSLFTGVLVYEVDLIGFQIINQPSGQSLERTYCNYEKGVALVCTTLTYNADFITVTHFETRTVAIPGTEWQSRMHTFHPASKTNNRIWIDYSKSDDILWIENIYYKDEITFRQIVKFNQNGDTIDYESHVGNEITYRNYYYSDSTVIFLEYVYENGNLKDFKNENLIFVDFRNHILVEADFIKLVNDRPIPYYLGFWTYQLNPEDSWMTGRDFIISQDTFLPEYKNRLKKVIKKIMKHRTI